MAVARAETGLAPLGSSFQACSDRSSAQKRSHSDPGNAFHRFFCEGRGSGRRASVLGDTACISSASADESTAASGSHASEAPSTPREHEQADRLGEEGSPELWPDTDNDEEVYEWSPCSRKRGAVRATVDNGTQASGVWCPTFLTPQQHFATTQSSSDACSLMPPMLLKMTAVALQGPRRFGGQFPPSARPVRTDGPVAPGGADSMESAMEAAASALAALAAAEAEPAEEGPDRARASQERAARAARGVPRAPGAKGAATAAPPAGAAKTSAGRGCTALQVGKSPVPPLRRVTSLMLSGLPRELGQFELLEDIHRSGFDGRVDFCYLPRNFASGNNVGHAFVNFVSSEVAAEFQRAWRGRSTCAGRLVGAPGVQIAVASVQGLAANIARSENPRMKRVRNPEYKPFVLDSGAAHAAGRP
ncbi:unnamed protein product [Prorocentrum cordatum]|uniref:Mei2-like C-terminal RNA recognition motif domain-containing protein n=1 Tax=Prorocentrum cordatum TaxID=2364126 RepID=A0ABN9SWF7_9DINO|nr:unnamed protein product [Polarella glacialis]